MEAVLKPRIVRRSLHDEILDHLRDGIVNGECKPGEKLNELELCNRLGVSRTPLREALKVLATEGLVTLTPNRGASVSKITEEEVADVFPIMGALEALGGELAATRMTAQEFHAIVEKHNRMTAHFRLGERLSYLRLNEDIHVDIMHASRNASLFHMWQMLMVRIKRVRFLATMTPEQWQSAVDDHEEMIEALRDHDGARLFAILKRHVRLKEATVRHALGQHEL